MLNCLTFSKISPVSPSLVSQDRIVWLVVRVSWWRGSPSSLLFFLPTSRLFSALFLSFVRFLFASTFLWIVWLPRIGFSMSDICLLSEDCDIIITKACNNGQNLSMFYRIMFYHPTSVPSLLPDRTKCTKNNQYPELFHTTNIKALKRTRQ